MTKTVKANAENKEKNHKISKIKIEDLEVDEYVYPRPQKDQGNVISLVEKLKAGIQLDPITVVKVKMPDGTERVIVLNGGHRLDAYDEFNKLKDYKHISDIPVEFWDEKIIDYEEYKDEMLIYSHRVNDKQGLNMRNIDTKYTARKLRKEHPDWSAGLIGKKLNRAQQTIDGHIRDIIQEQAATEHQLMIRLNRLGWSSPEISKIVVVKDSRIRQVVNNTDTSKINGFFGNGKKVEEIAKLYDIDTQTTWSIVLGGKSDLERFELLGFQPKVYDVWNFPNYDKLMGQEYPGQTPGPIVLNALYYYTKQGDLVVDLMAGGGTTNDACLLMGRKCYSYDINPPENRKDIIQHDYLNGLPDRAKKADLIFLDPPYFKKKEAEYGSESISALDREDYLKAIDKLAEVCEGHKVVLVMGKYYDYKKPEDSIFLAEYVNIFEKHGFRQIDEISIDQHPPKEGGQHVVNLAKGRRRMGILKRDLIFFSVDSIKDNKKEIEKAKEENE